MTHSEKSEDIQSDTESFKANSEPSQGFKISKENPDGIKNSSSKNVQNIASSPTIKFQSKTSQVEKIFHMQSKFVWSNRYILMKQSQTSTRSNPIDSAAEEVIERLNQQQNKNGQNHPFTLTIDPSNIKNLKINFLTFAQVEHILLAEIKKQEPYFEEEKKQLRLLLTQDQKLSNSSGTSVYLIELMIDYNKKLLDLQDQDETPMTQDLMAQDEALFLKNHVSCMTQCLISPCPANFQCPVINCDKSFQKNSKLRQHLKSHLSVRFYKCDYPDCQKSFKMPQHLSYHLTTHEKDKNQKFVCSYPGCNSEFRQKWILRDHEKTHQNVYKFHCEFEGCDKKYNTRSNLEVHLRKHAGVRPFVCNFCGKQYISKWNMAKHQKKGCTMIDKTPVEEPPAAVTQNVPILGKRIQLNVQQAHSGTKRMRHKNIPNKEELLKTEMKIQDQINQWMQVRRETKQQTEEEPQEVLSPHTVKEEEVEVEPEPVISQQPTEVDQMERNQRVKELIENFKKSQQPQKSQDLNHQINLQKLKLKLMQEQIKKKEESNIKSDLKTLLNKIEKYKNQNADKTGELNQMYNQLQNITKKLTQPAQIQPAFVPRLLKKPIYVPIVSDSMYTHSMISSLQQPKLLILNSKNNNLFKENPLGTPMLTQYTTPQGFTMQPQHSAFSTSAPGHQRTLLFGDLSKAPIIMSDKTQSDEN